MHRYVKRTLVLVVLAALGGLAGAFIPAGSATPAAPHASKAKVTVKVTMSEWKFKLSKRTVPAGSTVVFKVTNKGKIPHDFKIAGKKTKLLNPGKTQSITVKFGKKKGSFKYVCTVTGHARLGMQGKFGVGVKPPAGGGGGTTTTPTTTTTPGNVGSAQTTVQVNMIEYAFQLSQSTIPSGQVTFVIKNSGADVHNFDISGVKSGKIIGPGETETWTVALAPGQYLYVCDVPFHVDRGMTGTLQITQ
jgi:plastocyanin